MLYNNFFNLYDVFYKIVLKTDKGVHTKQGILFRDSNNLGLIIPKFEEFDNTVLKFVSIFSNQINDELEFSISPDCRIIYGDSLIFIPLEDLKISGNQIMHRKNGYPRSILSKLNYCLRSHFSESDNTFFVKSYSIYSYFILKNYGLIENSHIFSPSPIYVDGVPTQVSGSALYYIIASLDIAQYTGSPYLSILRNQKGEVFNVSIAGIVVDPRYHVLPSVQNTGIVITANGILEFLDSF